MSEDSGSESQSTPHSAPTPSKFKLLSSRSNRLTSKYSQTLLDFISEEPSVPSSTPSAPSSQRKPGWLSNLVSQRFRGATGGGGGGTTAAEAPARLTTVPNLEAEGRHQAVSHSTPLTPASKLLYVYPPQTKQAAELEGLVELCFPYGDKMPSASDFTIVNLKRTLQERHRTYRSPDSTFVLTIASQSNPCDVTYAICVICPLFADEAPQAQPPIGDDQETHDESTTQATGSTTSTITQCCLCLLSPYPFFSLFFKLLFGVAVLWEAKQRDFGEKYALALKENRSTSDLSKPLVLSDFVDHFQDILSKLKHMRIPSMGGWSRMSLSPELLTTQLSFHRSHSESLDMERRVLLLEYAAPTLFALLSVDQVLFLLGCLCCEHKVLVVSDHVNIVSSCVLALITLLSPLQWAGPVITVLPPRLDELLEAPVPLIAGRVSIDSALIPDFSTLQTPMKGVIEMNMEQNNLRMHDEDMRNYHELKLPGCDALVHELKFFSAQLFQKHVGDPDFPSVHQQEACEIICTRIHRHLEFICGLALGEDTDGVVVEAHQASGKLDVQPQELSQPEQSRRCSDLTLDYIRRFKETQMFSMFQLQHQEQQQEAELTAVAEEDDEADDGDLDGEEYDEDDVDLHTGDGNPDALFAVESISRHEDFIAHHVFCCTRNFIEPPCAWAGAYHVGDQQRHFYHVCLELRFLRPGPRRNPHFSAELYGNLRSKPGVHTLDVDEPERGEQRRLLHKTGETAIVSPLQGAKCGFVVGRFTEKAPAVLLENGLTVDEVTDILSRINAFRLANGRSSVVISGILMAAVTAHSKEQASTCTMAHTGVDGSMAWDRASCLEYPSMMVWENVAAGQQSVADVMSFWWNSPGHHDNILEPSVAQVGFAKIENSTCGYKRFWTQMFGRP